jgi:hypothetical protein
MSTNPIEPQPPQPVSLGDLAQLSLRSCVAYAVRCALRMRPRFQLPAEHPVAAAYVAAIDEAIALAAAIARSAVVDPTQAARIAEAAYRVADDAADVTFYSGFSAAHAAQAATLVCAVKELVSDGIASEVVASAYGASRVLEGNSQREYENNVIGALRADFDKLQSLSLGGFAELGQPIDPTEEGPLRILWPLGAPAWFHGL